MKALLSFLLIGCFASALATPTEPVKVKWCAQSEAENKKCVKLAGEAALKDKLTCVLKEGSDGCIRAIAAGAADAVTLDGGDIYKAGLTNYNLHPIIAEDYGKDSDTCYYAVAVAKAGTGFGFNQLKGKKSCHTGLGKSAGWNMPIGTLLAQGQISWGGIDDEDIVKAVSEFFSESCVPGVQPKYKNLCKLCKTDCSRTHKELYYDYAGAFRCLQESSGDDYVAFVKHTTVPVDERSKYELLCKDGTRKTLDKFAECHLARVPAHAVVSRKDEELTKRIWAMLQAAMTTGQLFSSPEEHKNLLFKDSTDKLVRLPESVDSYLYLGAEYMSVVRSLQKEAEPRQQGKGLRWCAVGKEETAKCDQWTTASADEEDGTAKIECRNGATVEECLKKIVRKEADAMAVDGGEVYTAGKCGLVPAMVEQYDEAKCISPGEASSYYAVAVVKKGSGFNWSGLKGKKSCHTGMGRTAGWNVPMGLIINDPRFKLEPKCNLTGLFGGSCAPGAAADSGFCDLCVGTEKGGVGAASSKCKASAEELYYGYAGAFRCLVEGGGDVAFIKHSIVAENTDGNGPEWAKKLKSSDYELLCLSDTRAPVTDYLTCHLAKVPAHAVVTRPEMQDQVAITLDAQQSRFGRSSNDFKMFESKGKNLLFKDSTKCLQKVPVGQSFKDFLGKEYFDSVTSLRACDSSKSDLEDACSFHSCQQKA